MMTIDEERRFLMLLASYFYVSRALVPDREMIFLGTEQRNWAMLSGKELDIIAPFQEPSWKLELGEAADQLRASGFYENAPGRCWCISDAGKEELYHLHEKLVSSFPMKLTSSAVEFAEGAFPFA